MEDFLSGLFGGGAADMTPSSSGMDTGGAGGSDMSNLFNMSQMPGGGSEQLKALLNDPQFMMALQMMMSKQKPDMMKMAGQMIGSGPKTSIGGLGGLGGLSNGTGGF